VTTQTTTEPVRACTTCLHVFTHPTSEPCRACTLLPDAAADYYDLKPASDHWEPLDGIRRVLPLP